MRRILSPLPASVPPAVGNQGDGGAHRRDWREDKQEKGRYMLCERLQGGVGISYSLHSSLACPLAARCHGI